MVAGFVGVLAIAALSCDAGSLLPSQSTFPTTAPGEVETVVAGTAEAAQSQTAEWLPASVTPSPTPTVTGTPTLVPTITPTFRFSLRTAVPPRTATPISGGGGSGGYGCVLVSQKPKDGTEYKPNAKFDMVWTLQNSGGTTWLVDDVDFSYVSGRKMHAQELYDIPRDVPLGESVSMTVKMNAPKLAGDWKTVWTLQAKGDDFCHVDVTIIVN